MGVSDSVLVFLLRYAMFCITDNHLCRAALNAPPYPGARPGGPGTESYEPPDLPAHPPRVTLRTRSNSPVPELVSVPANIEAMAAVYGPATSRAKIVSRGVQGMSRPTIGSSGYTIAESSSARPAMMTKTTSAFSGAQGAYISAGSSSSIAGGSGNSGNAGVGSYHFPHPLPGPFTAPVSTSMPMSTLTTSNPGSDIFGQNAVSCVQPQPHRYSSMDSSLDSSLMQPLPFHLAPSTQPFMHLGGTLDSEDSFSLRDVSSTFGLGGSLHFAALAPTFPTTASVPPSYAAPPGSSGWMPENMFGGAAASADGTGQMLGHSAGSRQVGIEVGTEEMSGQTGVVRFSSGQRAGVASKRKRRGVSVELEQPQGKRLLLDPNMRVCAAAELVASEMEAPNSSTAATMATSSTASEMSAPGETWFDGRHADCVLNARHKHYADGGVYFATDRDCMAAMHHTTAASSSPSEAAATTVSPVVSTEEESGDEMLSGLVASGDGQMDGQSAECSLPLPSAESPSRALPGQAPVQSNDESSAAPGAGSLRASDSPVSSSLPGTDQDEVAHVDVGGGENSSFGSFDSLDSLDSSDSFDSFDRAHPFAELCGGVSSWEMQDSTNMTDAGNVSAAITMDVAVESVLSASSRATEPLGLPSGTAGTPDEGRSTTAVVEAESSVGPQQTDADSLIDQILFGLDADDAGGGCSSNNNTNMGYVANADEEGIDFAQ